MSQATVANKMASMPSSPSAYSWHNAYCQHHYSTTYLSSTPASEKTSIHPPN